MTMPARSAKVEPVPALRLSGLSKTFPGQQALAGVDLTVDPGEVHALLGENGSGKSTLIKVLSGFHKPDAGAVVEIGGESLAVGSPSSSHRLGARFVHQDLGLIGTMSVADNLFLGDRFPGRFGTIRAREQHRAARELLAAAGLDVDPDLPVCSLSPAIRTGVAVARALRTVAGEQVRLLVLDEPTATLPDNEVHQLLEIVRSVAASGVGVVYVTHRIDEIFEICSRVSVLRDGRKVAERAVEGLTHSELVHLLVGNELSLLERPIVDSELIGEAMLSARNLHSDQLFNMTFQAHSGSVTGIAGITGSGREKLLGSMFGAIGRSGEVTIAGATIEALNTRAAIRAGAGFVPADRKTHGGVMTMTARENLTLPELRRFSRRLTMQRSQETTETRVWFDRLSVRPRNGTELPLSQFSGGNQQKVVIAKWLRRHPKVLLVDEPTQGVDIAAKAEIHRHLRSAAEQGRCIVVSCSDPMELVDLCDRVLVLRRGRVVADLRGSDVTADRISRISIHGGSDQ
jgi:ribose transport system ATP-binding protein